MRREWRGNYSQDISYERRIYSQKKDRKEKRKKQERNERRKRKRKRKTNLEPSNNVSVFPVRDSLTI